VIDLLIVKIVAERLGIPEERLIREALREWIERKLLLVESEIKEVLLRHGVSNVAELEEKIKKGEVEERPAWEDITTLENLIGEKKRLEEALKIVKEA